MEHEREFSSEPAASENIVAFAERAADRLDQRDEIIRELTEALARAFHDLDEHDLAA
ncbi:MAG: hypothetical protein WEC75_13340 [Dehalococcoidia bacterium]